MKLSVTWCSEPGYLTNIYEISSYLILDSGVLLITDINGNHLAFSVNKWVHLSELEEK